MLGGLRDQYPRRVVDGLEHVLGLLERDEGQVAPLTAKASRASVSAIRAVVTRCASRFPIGRKCSAALADSSVITATT
jgi:hypothetical protein